MSIPCFPAPTAAHVASYVAGDVIGAILAYANDSTVTLRNGSVARMTADFADQMLALEAVHHWGIEVALCEEFDTDGRVVRNFELVEEAA